MRGNDKLAAVKPRGIFNEFRQFLLQFGGQAVFRLVEQVKRIFADAVRKIGERAFPLEAVFRLLGSRRVTYADLVLRLPSLKRLSAS